MPMQKYIDANGNLRHPLRPPPPEDLLDALLSQMYKLV